MRLKNLHLVNFKNYAAADLEFNGMIHCFLGKNGSGKTNILEAIHYLAFTKGGKPGSDTDTIRYNEDHFMIRGIFEKTGNEYEVACAFSGERKKTMMENGKEYIRFSEHIGKYPIVTVAPADIELIWDGGEVRRRFFDTLLAQLDKEYLEHLMVYQAHLRQRNSLLKMFAERGMMDRDLLASYDEKMVASGNILFRKRVDFVTRFTPLLEKRYDLLVSGTMEKPGLQYQSELATCDFKTELAQRLDRDLALGRTTIGTHRDDFLFTLQGKELKRFGSQGQQKSFLIALKLAEFDCLASKVGFKPLLLLDDIFDKLDDDRIVQLMKLVAGDTFGQIFITDARPGRSLEVLRESGVKSQNFLVEGGTVERLDS